MRTYSCTSRSAALIHSTIRNTLIPAPRHAELARLQLLDPVPQLRGLLELQVGGRRLHLQLQLRDVRLELRVGAEPSGELRRDRHVIPLVNARHHIVNALD